MSEVLQVLKGTSAQPRVLFYSDGVLTSLDGGAMPSVTLTRPDGTAGPASGTVTSPGTGTYTFTLTATSTAEVTVYDIAWAGSIGGQPQTITTRVEVVGNFLYTLAGLRAMKVAGGQPFASTAVPLYSDQQLHDARTAITDEFERILGFSAVPRHARDILDGNGDVCLVLGKLEAHRLLSVSVNGAAQQTSGYVIRKSGILEAVSGYRWGSPFTYGRANVAVEYVHGLERVPGRGGNIAMLMAANLLQPGFGSTARSVVTPDGTSYDLGDPAGQVTAAGTVRHTGIPVIDSWFHRWTASSGVA